MPTGYTAKLYEEPQTFQEFALDCARAFGALILMRDDPPGTPIPEEFKPSEFYRKEAERASTALAEAEAWDEAKWHEEAERAYQDAVTSNHETIAKLTALRERYEAMLEQAKAWRPPSEDYVKFREFMIEQLESSIASDCDTSYYKPPVPTTWEIYKFYELDRRHRSAAYAEQSWCEEVERTEGRNRWIRQLRASLALANPGAEHEG